MPIIIWFGCNVVAVLHKMAIHTFTYFVLIHIFRPPNVQSAAVLTPGEKMLNRFKDVAQSKPTFSKIFGKK